ncbi:PREDICTED: uncharacterized protein LOC106814838 [Priapulus caudatus]|uniref:Uncharacterized protein LOC106814838 n=1 Tax=Priapulus caudatus TaxID=37621 RepID=A0ABM1ER63_PRICU|nr:PREDICTED: uncharacterized protein LOC106814838 [Priapulus caudatus]
MAPDDARYHRYVFRQNPEDPIEVSYELTRRVTSEFGNGCRTNKSSATLTIVYYPVDGKASVLGTQRDLHSDTLSVRDVKLGNFTLTKRNILKRTDSYYNIFGMLSGVLVRPKILLQKLWQFDIDWDTPISRESDLYTMWEVIEHDLTDLNKIEIRRCLIPRKYHGQKSLPKVSLHGASDASKDAMGIGVWLRWTDGEDGCGDVTFVCARARLTPLKQSSMPRKELQAILLLSRLMSTVKNALRLTIDYTKIWTDSITAIGWLRGQSKSFPLYVACCVVEITTEFDPIKDIAYVLSEHNVIDLVSQGVKADDMLKVIEGPVYLRHTPDMWPVTPINIPVVKDDIEQKKFHVKNAKVLAVNLTTDEPIVDPKKFSSWTRLLMVTARILSLKDLPKCLWLKQMTTKLCEWPSMKQIKEAETYWIRQAQKDINFNNHQIIKLYPFLDVKEKMYRVGGRIHRAPLSYDTAFIPSPKEELHQSADCP